MEKLNKPKSQKSILDFFHKSSISFKENNTNIEETKSTVNGLLTLGLSTRKRKRAVSHKVKAIIKANKKKKREIIIVSDETDSDISEYSIPSNEKLLELEEDSILLKNEIVEQILCDWNTPEKMSNSVDLKENDRSKIEEKYENSDKISYKDVIILRDPNKSDLCESSSKSDKYIRDTGNMNDTAINEGNMDMKLDEYKKWVENTPLKPVEDCEMESAYISRKMSKIKMSPFTSTQSTPTHSHYHSTNNVNISPHNSLSNSLLKVSRIVSPERTPTPSPSYIKFNANISPNIRNSPGKFNLNNILSSPLSTLHLKNSPSSSGTTRLNRSIRNITNSPNYGNSVKRKLSLNSDNAESQHFLHDSSAEGSLTPSKYRKTNGLYLDNFNFIMTYVMSSGHDSTLFNNDDNKVIGNFGILSLEAKKLFVRLFQRKVRWLKFEKIYYADICEKEDSYIYLNELIYSEFLQSETHLEEINVILKILGKKDLLQLCKDFKVKPVGTSENIIDNLIKNTSQQRTILSIFGGKNQIDLLSKRAKLMVGKCFILNKESRDVFMRILTLFSLPSAFEEDEDAGQQSQLTILLMQKLRKLEFPSYEVIRASSIFPNRESLIRFTKCYQLDCNARDLMERKDWDKVVDICKEANNILIDLLQDSSVMLHDTILASFLRKFTAISILLHIQSYLVEALQKLKRYEEAVNGLEFLLGQKIHLQDSKGRWYDRLALNYEQHLKNPEKALNIIIEGLADREVMVGHRLALSQRAERIMKSKKGKHLEETFKQKISIVSLKDIPKVKIQANSLPSEVPGFKRIYIDTNDIDSTTDETAIISSVEELVISHYKKQGYSHGLHGEGRTVRVIFGLLFWDCIYSTVPDVFLSPYQGAPLDLNSRHFYEARKDAIDKRLSNLRQMNIEAVYEEIENIWKCNEGKVSIVNWSVFNDIQHVKSLITCLGIDLVTSICERLCKNHRFTRSGFPDLIVWNVTDKTSRIVEVKGPNDKLSTKQILWLEFLIDNGAIAEVCHVEALGGRRLIV